MKYIDEDDFPLSSGLGSRVLMSFVDECSDNIIECIHVNDIPLLWMYSRGYDEVQWM